MKVKFQNVTVNELVEGYLDNREGGVRGYNNRLDIRPPYQREFVYKDKQRAAVIRSIQQGFPLNVMYWADNGDDQYEVIDGQQRTISIGQYVKGDFSVDGLYFDNQTDDKRNHILNYKLMVYVCTGTESEKLDWFRTVNIAGVKLTNQELLNAVYTGKWLADAKRHFSRTGGPAYSLGADYVKGNPIRQDYLETVLKWISDGQIEDYMGKHQHDSNAEPLWEYFKAVISWVNSYFKPRPKLMRGLDWGRFYDEYKDAPVNYDATEKRIQELIQDEEVQKQRGIYEYILTGEERHLNLRTFDNAVKQRVYERQGGKCAQSGEEYPLSEMEADHITPWSEGGKTEEDNCQILHKKYNRRKGAK